MAIIVTLDSDVDELRANLADCSACMHLVICDNSEDAMHRAAIREFAESQRMAYLSMGGNLGIGCAQNRGIEFAKQNGAEFVLLLDDDSRLTCTALSGLLKAYFELQALGNRVGAVGGRAIDRHDASESSIGREEGAFMLSREMMSSGSLIPIAVLGEVGFMDESLFVDYVDFEWGWRAIEHGYKLYLANDVIFLHALGEGSYRILGIKVKLKSPIRHYYQTRNTLLLLRRRYVPMGWRVKNLVRTLIKCVVFSMFISPRGRRFLYAFRGLRDGLWGNESGPTRSANLQ
jgi:rhamnosyltransferase